MDTRWHAVRTSLTSLVFAFSMSGAALALRSAVALAVVMSLAGPLRADEPPGETQGVPVPPVVEQTAAGVPETPDAAAQTTGGRTLPNDPGDRDHNLGATHTMKQLQGKLNNPLSDLWSLQFQNTTQFNAGGPSSGTYRGVNTTVFQPAMPVPLTKDWTLINRPIFSVVDTPTFDPVDGDWDRTSGVGPISYEGWITSSKPSKLQLGFGGVVGIPLSTRDELNSRKYTAGPSMVAVYKHADWVVWTLAQYQWSFSGSNKREEVSKASIQYFVNWMGLPNHWQISLSPTITYNRKASGPDAWAVPIGIGVGKMVKFGKLPVKLQLEFDAYPIHPDDSFGPRYAIKFTITPVILALIKTPLL